MCLSQTEEALDMRSCSIGVSFSDFIPWSRTLKGRKKVPSSCIGILGSDGRC